jgi:hypothetical protein
MRVDLRGAKVAVSEQFLYLPQVGTTAEHLGGQGVAEDTWDPGSALELGVSTEIVQPFFRPCQFLLGNSLAR